MVWLLPIKLKHLQQITDETGLLEHCFGKIPRRKEGYSTDDNARALWLCTEWIRYANRRKDWEAIPELEALADRYFQFLMWIQGEDGWFHNNVSYNRSFEQEEPSDDCQGRSLWALSAAILNVPDSRSVAQWMAVCRQGFQAVSGLRRLRGIAHTLSAASALLEGLRGGDGLRDEVEAGEMIKKDEFSDWAKTGLPTLIRNFTDSLCRSYEMNQQPGWHWFESKMTYANGVFPWALFRAYPHCEETQVLQIANESLNFLIERMTAPGGYLRPVGNRGWATPEKTSMWDQQPLEVMKLALACAEGLKITADSIYHETLEHCVAWFQGKNDAGVPLVDSSDGGCCDGLQEDGLNKNQGAESTLSYLLTEVIYHNSLDNLPI